MALATLSYKAVIFFDFDANSACCPVESIVSVSCLLLTIRSYMIVRAIHKRLEENAKPNDAMPSEAEFLSLVGDSSMRASITGRRFAGITKRISDMKLQMKIFMALQMKATYMLKQSFQRWKSASASPSSENHIMRGLVL